MEQYLFSFAEAADPVDGAVEVRANVWLMSADEIPQLQFTADEVARVLRVDAPTIAELIARGELRTVAVCGATRIPAQSVATYAASLDVGSIR